MSNDHREFAIAVELHRAGKFAEAASFYRRSIATEPSCAESYCNLGVVLVELGQIEEAIEAYQNSIELRPDIAATHNNLGNAYKLQGKLHDALLSYQNAIALRSDYADPIYNLANILREDGQLELAVQLYQRVLSIQPRFAEAYNNLGNALRSLGQSEAAVAVYQQALVMRPEFAQSHHNLAVLMQALGDHEAAVISYQRSLELTPQSGRAVASLLFAMQTTCDWSRLDELSDRVLRAVEQDAAEDCGEPVDSFSLIALTKPTSAEQQLRCAQKYARHIQKHIVTDANIAERREAARYPSRLRIGYLSGDFREHAVANAIVELFEAHDRRTFEIFGYSFGPDDQSRIRQRIVAAFDHFRDVRLESHVEVAHQIERDKIDILVDLQGHTGETRAEILAHHPAPIQVNYLGYPGTMGGELANYILVDDFVVPLSQRNYFSEQIIHLPGCYMVSDSQRSASPWVPSREECELPNDAFVFCAFSSTFKVTPELFNVWMRLLRSTPKSVLWLLDGNPTAKSNLCREAELRGVDSSRLVFAQKVPLRETHLARQRNIDLFLDTFPYNSHSTASDLLWLGIPLITLAGKTFASRVAGSLLRAVEMPELITESLDEYECLALRLAQDREALSRLKKKLDMNKSLLERYHGAPFARNIEQIFVSISKQPIDASKSPKV